MNKNITDFILQYERDQFATSTGRAMHRKLQNVSLAPVQSGDIDLIEKIKNSDALLQSFFMLYRAFEPNKQKAFLNFMNNLH